MPDLTHVRVRMYPIGFGDCFLVSFLYDGPVEGRDRRHMLFDFGSNAHGGDLATLAGRIAGDCDGELDVVVVTHRHKDHLSGFANDEAAAIIAGLKPKRIIQPWTERPGAAADARRLSIGGDDDPTAPGQASRRFAARLEEGQRFAADLAAAIGARRRGALGDLRRLAAQAIKNEKAVKRLQALSRNGKGRYVHYGGPLDLDAVLPGVDVRVLGPPTIEQHADVRKHEVRKDSEYWLWPGAPPVGLAVPATARPGWAPPADVPLGPARWLVERLERQGTGALQRIVTSLDEALNNTSVILLIRAGERRLLFSGDAEMPNWEYALFLAEDREAVAAELRQVDLYKVGHHGSRNATPRTLVRYWTEGAEGERPRTALLSTRVGVYPSGKPPGSETAVPRVPLVNGLAGRMTLYSTGELEARFGYDGTRPRIRSQGVTVEAPVTGAAPFAEV